VVSFGLTLTTNRSGSEDCYVVGEPVYATLHLANLSSQPAYVHIRPALQADIQIEVETPFAPRRRVAAPLPRIVVPRGEDGLFPFETRDYVVKLFYDPQDRPLLSRAIDGREEIISWPNLVFDLESYYRIYAQMAFEANLGMPAFVEAPFPDQILVRAPKPGSPEDLILGRLCQDKRRLEACQQLFAEPREREFFERAVADFPDTRYTPTFLYLLARSYTQLEGEELQRSIGYFQRLLKDYPDFPGIRSARIELGLTYAGIGMSDKAAAIARQLVEEDPGTLQRMGRASLIRKYVGFSRLEYDPMFWMLVP
jgi:tetratricopeptide (TPR) repeat protein